MKNRMVILDVETTGLSPRVHELIEICAMRPLRPGETPFVDAHPINDLCAPPLAEMNRLAQSTGSAIYWRRIKPVQLQTAELEAMQINGYTEEKWTGSLSWGAHIDSLTAFLGPAIFCGHHVTSDRQFINETYRRLGMSPPGRFRTVDTMTLAWEHLVPWGLQSLSLHAICSMLNISNDNEHTAFADVVRTRQAYLTMSRATVLHRAWWGTRLKLKGWKKALRAAGRSTSAQGAPPSRRVRGSGAA